MPIARTLLAASLLTLSLAPVAAAEPQVTSCQVDARRYRGGYADLLYCGSERIRGLSVQASGHELTGVSWRQQDGTRERSITLDHTGQVFFLVHDDAIRGGFYAKSRALWRHVFPRRHEIRIERTQDALHVHDPAGNTWTLTPTPMKSQRVSWAVSAINGKPQRLAKMDHSERGVIGADLRALGSVVLYRKERGGHGLQDRRSPAYHRTKSVFVDARGARCEVANGELFGPNPNDPDDRYDNVFRFRDDAPVRELLERACPKLDVGALAGADLTLAH